MFADPAPERSERRAVWSDSPSERAEAPERAEAANPTKPSGAKLSSGAGIRISTWRSRYWAMATVRCRCERAVQRNALRELHSSYVAGNSSNGLVVGHVFCVNISAVFLRRAFYEKSISLKVMIKNVL